MPSATAPEPGVRARVERGGLVWPLLAQALRSVSPADRAPAVLDCGGGTGRLAVALAEAGAHVTVVDASADALATLRRRAVEAGVADRVVAVQADVESLSELPGHQRFELVVAHGILEAVDDLSTAFAAIAAAVGPAGLLSVLVTNPVAVVLARALAGDVEAALSELLSLDADFRRPGPVGVEALCHTHGLRVEQRHGIGVFTDLVPGSALEAPGAARALAELESAAATRPPFADIAAKIHLLARR